MDSLLFSPSYGLDHANLTFDDLWQIFTIDSRFKNPLIGSCKKFRLCYIITGIFHSEFYGVKDNMVVKQILENAFYMLALLNPASKIMFLAAYEPKLTRKQNFELSWKSSAAALIILTILAAAGHFILSRIFRVELYSLQITGGFVVFVIGLAAVNEGRFVKKQPGEQSGNITDISLVPLAAPLIAGPGMIAAAIANSVANGFIDTTLSLGIAIFINFLLMICSSRINSFLTRTHMLGPLIRLTGLVIAAVAMQMILTGIKVCFNLS